ncbi:MAG TPA: glycosyltransferase family 4 protein [Xanthobacteraceae bacterium]|jgi:glycosyltransferase involved in cell wall biosynthesis|nr:glycosyltransferase family 4 protein [Xanthobacteraceae bacterium]
MSKLLFFHSEDWAFLRHFLPMARAAQAAGFEVAVAVRVRDHADRLKAAGCRVIPLEAERRSLGPFEILRSVARMIRILRAERPDVVHCIALRTVVLGGLAARLAGVPRLVLAPTGLGHLWIENGPVERLARPLARFVIGRVLRSPSTRYLFENSEDPREFGLDPEGPNVTIVGGAGVDPAQVPVTPEPPMPPMKVAVVGRMLVPKGIGETVAAVRRARAEGAPVELNLYGEPDPSNRRSCSEDQLRRWAAEPGIAWHGPTDDVARVWRENHVAMLLSYREGLPKALVEAAAAGRPIVASDVTGCREVVRDGIEGLLVPLGDVDAAAQALVRLAGDPALRARLGAAAHARFQARFTEAVVVQTMTELYARAIRKS